MRVPAVMSVCFHVYARCVCFRVTSLLYVRYSGSVGDGGRITQKTMLRYTWRLVVGRISLSDEVHLLCRHAARRGVHPPKHWKHELMAVSAIQRVRDEFALSDSVKLDCRLLFGHAHTHRLVRFVVDVCICCTHVAGSLESAVLLRPRVLIIPI